MLSKTFQHAIHVVRQLGIRYLWIDSLCILQDSKEDWDKESAAMSERYQNALITIAASQAKNGDEGCFVQRNPSTTWPCKLNLTSNSGKSLYLCPNGKYYAHGPLYKRAWAYQEKILSHRSVAFSDDTVYWSCWSLLACERDPKGASQDENSGTQILRALTHGPEIRAARAAAQRTDGSEAGPDGNGSLTREDEEILDARKAIASRAIAQFRWQDVVHNFTEGNLTVHSDRLPALSGLASIFQSRLGTDEYIAGLWLSDIARGLLWDCVRDKGQPLNQRSHPPLTYLAPSWSWASLINSTVSYGYVGTMTLLCTWQPEIQVLDTSCNLRGTNRFGEVDSAELKINGCTAAITVPNLHGGHVRGRGSVSFKDDSQPLGTLSLDEEDNLQSLTAVLVLAVVSLFFKKNSQEDEEDSQKSKVECLVLQATHASSADEYRRIGTASVDRQWFMQHGEARTLTLV